MTGKWLKMARDEWCRRIPRCIKAQSIFHDGRVRRCQVPEPVGREHIAVAVAREQEKASPISGSWFGPAEAFAGMDVVVEVAPA